MPNDLSVLKAWPQSRHICLLSSKLKSIYNERIRSVPNGMNILKKLCQWVNAKFELCTTYGLPTVS